MGPIELIGQIDRQFLKCKKNRESRFGTEWGKWSRQFNLKLRPRIESEAEPDKAALKFVFIYWVEKSRLLEYYHKSKAGLISKKKKAEKELARIRKIVSTGEAEEVEGGFQELVRMIR